MTVNIRKKNTRKIVIFTIVIMILLLSALIFFLFSFPKNAEFLKVSLGCVLIDDTDITYPPHVFTSFTPKNGEDYGLYTSSGGTNFTIDFMYTSFVLKTAIYIKTDESPTDAQIAHFEFLSGDENVGSVLFAYDLPTEQLFALKNNRWYRVYFTGLLDDLIVSHYNNALGTLGYMWRRQTTFCEEEYICRCVTRMDFSASTFRYRLHWEPTMRPSDTSSFQDSGFNVVTPTEITSREEAIEIAAQEMGYENHIGIALYDEISDYWMVEIVDSTNFNGQVNTPNGHYLFENVYTLIIDNQGLVTEKYQSVTIFSPFQDKWW